MEGNILGWRKEEKAPFLCFCCVPLFADFPCFMEGGIHNPIAESPLQPHYNLYYKLLGNFPAKDFSSFPTLIALKPSTFPLNCSHIIKVGGYTYGACLTSGTFRLPLFPEGSRENKQKQLINPEFYRC